MAGLFGEVTVIDGREMALINDFFSIHVAVVDMVRLAQDQSSHGIRLRADERLALRVKGNEAVDTLLREFAVILRSTEHFSSTAYRLNGSEFALLFPDFRQDAVVRVIERLKHDIDALGKSYQQPDFS